MENSPELRQLRLRKQNGGLYSDSPNRTFERSPLKQHAIQRSSSVATLGHDNSLFGARRKLSKSSSMMLSKNERSKTSGRDLMSMRPTLSKIAAPMDIDDERTVVSDGHVSSSNSSSANKSFPVARRCTSDTSLWRARPSSAGGSPFGSSNSHFSRFSPHRRQATALMSTRGNAKGVTAVVESIKRSTNAGSSPAQQCLVLSQVADDAYYRVVIGSAQGVAVLVKAMEAFPRDAVLQEACCAALGKLCEKQGMNRIAMEQSNGVSLIVAAMRTHPSSVAVQSAACEALQSLSSLILTQVKPLEPAPQLVTEVVAALENADHMYITPSSKAACRELLSIISTALNQCKVQVHR